LPVIRTQQPVSHKANTIVGVHWLRPRRYRG
jgi:hypothetical protein